MKIEQIKQKFSIAITTIFIGLFGFFVFAEQPFDKAVFNDSDQDGLSDEEEKIYGTDPYNPDTDGDGYSDGAEVRGGYDPLIPAPGDRIISTNNEVGESGNSTTATPQGSFDSEVASFLQQKDGEDISMDELKDFVAGNIGSEIASAEKNASLTEDEIKNIKIKKQNYSELSEADKKEREKRDAMEYIGKVAEILLSNAPMKLESDEDVKIAYEVFIDKFEKLNSAYPDYEYFRAYAEKLKMAEEQLSLVVVPENWLDLHIRFLEIVRNIYSLKDLSKPMEDPTGKLVIMSRVVVILELADDFQDKLVARVLEVD